MHVESFDIRFRRKRWIKFKIGHGNPRWSVLDPAERNNDIEYRCIGRNQALRVGVNPRLSLHGLGPDASASAAPPAYQIKTSNWSSGQAVLNSTTLHNVFLPGAGTGGKTCPSRAMMATSDTVRRFRLPVPGCRRCCLWPRLTTRAQRAGRLNVARPRLSPSRLPVPAVVCRLPGLRSPFLP